VDNRSTADIVVTEGLTFNTLRAALAFIYFGEEGMTEDRWQSALLHVMPMQHNMENPIRQAVDENVDAKNTYIEFWIDEDDRVTQDYAGQRWAADDDENGSLVTPFQSTECMKTARITIRFLGHEAEAWAKLFHHLTRRKDVGNILYDYCNGQLFEYVGPIRPINVDYFGVQNTVVAYDIVFVLQYTEVIRVPSRRLGLLTVAAGDMVIQ
jgi:hypothetical protein